MVVFGAVVVVSFLAKSFFLGAGVFGTPSPPHFFFSNVRSGKSTLPSEVFEISIWPFLYFGSLVATKVIKTPTPPAMAVTKLCFFVGAADFKYGLSADLNPSLSAGPVR